ncbi:MAG: hypothetical protein OXG60_13850 [Chloroflexi bacterium]|nr:hypothetical protein [Chloroflexota bacterium]
MTRLYKDARTLDVQTRDAIPIAIQWRQAWHPIQHITLSWQMDVNWWHERIYRDYYKVLTQKGLVLVIYHDLLTDLWAIQRIYD